MTYYSDYNWDVRPDRLVLDRDFNLKTAGWNEGEYFKIVYVDGRHQFIKIDPVEQFNLGAKVNGT